MSEPAQEGPEVIRAYCDQRQYAVFVIKDGLEYLIPSWERNVREVEAGYQAMHEEYLNDMDGRRIISEVWPLASDDQREVYEDRLAEADRRFLAATTAVSNCIWGQETAARNGYTPEADWYYYRVPRDKGPNW
jgi:hypothetical protein